MEGCFNKIELVVAKTIYSKAILCFDIFDLGSLVADSR
jgi:hypothetical protein